MRDRFACAARGLFDGLFHQRSLRIHFVAICYVLYVSAIAKLSAAEWCVILLFCALVFAAEMLNSALEGLCDGLTREPDRVIRRVKDMAAGAVLVCAVFAVAGACILFLRPENFQALLTANPVFYLVAALGLIPTFFFLRSSR